ncbi:flocculation protein FLO9-like [Scomber scombrus]|uniref:Flocculation protein FLO9-like n=1 Tax=Scomber scombrus TaxID=13677 RepID=A0AAV1P7M4_SCOSC
MDTIVATLACVLLVPSFVVAQTEKGNISLALTPTITTPRLNLTYTTRTVTTSNSTVLTTVTGNLTDDDTAFTSISSDNDTFTTSAPPESTKHRETSQSTTVMTPVINSTSLITTNGTQMSTFTVQTTPATKTTAGHISTSDKSETSDTSLTTNTDSSSTVNTTSDSTYKTSQVPLVLGLDVSEKSMTILFSVVLGVFAFALVLFMFHRCKHKTQYLHQPLNNTNDTDAFVADNDTLVISGGLYDGHPIYDNIPPVPADQSQFRLEFLH